MIKTLEKSGRTEEDALNAALSELGLERDDVSVEIVERAKSGFLGIGAVHAVVRVSYEAPDEPEAKPAAPEVKRTESRPAAPAPAKKPENIPAKPRTAPESAKQPVPETENNSTSEYAQATADFLTGLLDRMGVKAGLVLTDREDGGINVDVRGASMGAIIGRRGETLDAIQHLANYVVNRGSENHVHISVDAENYRAKREESLVHLAQKMAAKVLKYKRSMALEPMNSYERHVIHTALQDFEGVSTGSTGTEPNRRVVISYERGQGQDGFRRQSGGQRYNNGPRRSAPAPARETEPAAAPAEAEKPAEAAVPSETPAPAAGTDTGSKKPQSREWA
jgi:spoIIIJ-associated protein